MLGIDSTRALQNQDGFGDAWLPLLGDTKHSLCLASISQYGFVRREGTYFFLKFLLEIREKASLWILYIDFLQRYVVPCTLFHLKLRRINSDFFLCFLEQDRNIFLD